MSQRKQKGLMSPYQQALSTMPANTSQVVQFINYTKEGSVPLKALLRPPMNFSSIEHVKSFILRNEDNFTISNNQAHLSGTEIVWVKTALKLCDSHCRKGLTCTGSCNCLHICRNFLLRGSRFCPFGNKKNERCMFGHNLRDQHNRTLLRKHNLDLLTEQELRTLFCRRTCRSMSTMPQVCLYYNGRRGKKCNNKNCKSLHYCIDHLQSICVGPCNKSHSLGTAQNRNVLSLFAIDPEIWSEGAFLADLRQVMEHRRASDNSSHYSGSQDDDEDDDDGSDISGDTNSNGPPPAYQRLGAFKNSRNKGHAQDKSSRYRKQNSPLAFDVNDSASDDSSEDNDGSDVPVPFDDLCVSDTLHNNNNKTVAGSKGLCCPECRKNKALVQHLLVRVECLENNLTEMKETLRLSSLRGQVGGVQHMLTGPPLFKQ